MNSIILPAARKIRCHAFCSTAISRKVGKKLIDRHSYGRHNWKSGIQKYQSSPYWSIPPTSTIGYDECDERYSLYESVSSYLFRQGKTWKRLSHLLEMAAGDQDKSEEAQKVSGAKKESVADVGTDHGLLAMGLALTGKYSTVVGVDVSDQALTYGALSMLEKIRNQTKTFDEEGFESSPELPVEFRLGNGLEALELGEADIICIAGMGVNTMLQILEPNGSGCRNLEKIGCKRLVLQATNSRPRNLIRLYDRLQEMGWKVEDERIEKLSSRWYITARFELENGAEYTQHDPEKGGTLRLELPGSKLQSLNKENAMREIFDEYCLHHKQWIQKDSKLPSYQMDTRDNRWLEYFFEDTI